MQNATGLSVLTAAELLAADLEPRRELLAPLLASDTAALVWGPAGIGKSFFALSLAWAVAGGGSFLGWRSPGPHRVLYVDGELGAATLRERLALFGPPPAGLRISTWDLGERLDLTGKLGVVRLMKAWGDPDLLVLDTGVRSDDADRLHRFLLHQRKHGRAIVLVQHANKDGDLRGSTERCDAFDLMVALHHPDKGSAGGARFELHFDKARQHQSLQPLIAALETDATGRAHWRWEPATGTRLETAVALFKRGLTAREAAAALGISRTSLFRLKARARAQGLLS